MIGTQMGQRKGHSDEIRRAYETSRAQHADAHPLPALLRGSARPLRFALTGGLAGLLQLGLLALLTGRGWPEIPANALARYISCARPRRGTGFSDASQPCTTYQLRLPDNSQRRSLV